MNSEVALSTSVWNMGLPGLDLEREETKSWGAKAMLGELRACSHAGLGVCFSELWAPFSYLCGN